MTRYAATTTVSVEKSKAEIERLLTKYGCNQFTTGTDRIQLRAQVQFALEERIVRFVIALPDPASDDYQTYENGRAIPDGARVKFILQDERQRWRALFLSIKARLVSWDEHIETRPGRCRRTGCCRRMTVDDYGECRWDPGSGAR